MNHCLCLIALTSAVITATLAGGRDPDTTLAHRSGFFTSPRLATLLLMRALYFCPMSRNSLKTLAEELRTAAMALGIQCCRHTHAPMHAHTHSQPDSQPATHTHARARTHAHKHTHRRTLAYNILTPMTSSPLTSLLQLAITCNKGYSVQFQLPS